MYKPNPVGSLTHLHRCFLIVRILVESSSPSNIVVNPFPVSSIPRLCTNETFGETYQTPAEGGQDISEIPYDEFLDEWPMGITGNGWGCPVKIQVLL